MFFPAKKSQFSLNKFITKDSGKEAICGNNPSFKHFQGAIALRRNVIGCFVSESHFICKFIRKRFYGTFCLCLSLLCNKDVNFYDKETKRNVEQFQSYIRFILVFLLDFPFFLSVRITTSWKFFKTINFVR